MRISTAIRRFEAQLRAEGKSPRTLDAYLRDLRLLERSLGPATPLRAITPHRLTRFLNSRAFTHTAAGLPRAPITLNRSKTAIRMFFRFLTDAGYIKDNPARLVRAGRVSRKPPAPMSSVEVRKLLSTIRRHRDPLAQRDHLMFRLMLGTGIRLGALVGLDVDDVNLGVGTIRVRTKGGLEQVVYVNSKLSKALRLHVRALLGCSSAALFQSRQGRGIRPRQVQIRFAQWRLLARIEHRYTVHSLRHTFATRLYEQTRDIRLVQHALGHRRVSSTEVYTAVADGAVRRAMGRLRV